MDKFFESNAIAGAPPVPSPGSIGHPTDGDLVHSVPPTTPGAWWFHMITEEIRNVIVAAGIVPSGAAVNQLLAALNALFVPSSGSVVTSVNGASGVVTVATGLALNAVGYVTFIVVPGGPVLGTEGSIVSISGRPGSWLIAGYALAASDTFTVAIRVA